MRERVQNVSFEETAGTASTMSPQSRDETFWGSCEAARKSEQGHYKMKTQENASKSFKKATLASNNNTARKTSSRREIKRSTQ